MGEPVYRAQNAISALGPDFYDAVEAAAFPQHILRYRNDRAAAEVGLAGLSDDEWVRHFGRFDPLPGSLPQPLALRYHGHQFRTYSPELGDGRGFLFAQMLDADGRLPGGLAPVLDALPDVVRDCYATTFAAH